MEKVKKLIDIDKDVLIILNDEAKRQKRSLKSLLEITIQETANKLKTPSREYTDMMDSMLARLEKGEVDFTPIEEMRNRYGL